MRDECSLEQKLEAMLTVALEPISAEELALLAGTITHEIICGIGARVPRVLVD